MAMRRLWRQFSWLPTLWGSGIVRSDQKLFRWQSCDRLIWCGLFHLSVPFVLYNKSMLLFLSFLLTVAAVLSSVMQSGDSSLRRCALVNRCSYRCLLMMVSWETQLLELLANRQWKRERKRKLSCRRSKKRKWRRPRSGNLRRNWGKGYIYFQEAVQWTDVFCITLYRLIQILSSIR